MSDDRLNDNLKTPKVDIRQRVMGEIKKKDIKMTSPLFLLAQKIGLESILALVILGGALAFTIVLYILKKIGAFKFLKLGIPGLKVFLLSVPYDYIALFLITLLVGNYIIHRLDFSLGIRNYFNIPAVALLVVTVFLGAFFAAMGGEQLIRIFSEKRNLPHEIAIKGKVVEVASREVDIENESGQVEKIILSSNKIFPYASEYAEGKIIRAIGQRDQKNGTYFYADDIICCDAD